MRDDLRRRLEAHIDAQVARLAVEEFHQVGGAWAGMQPDFAWASGRPPKAYVNGFYVAIKTETGRIMTGTLNCFAKCADTLEADPKYGQIKQWIPFGEPS